MSWHTTVCQHLCIGQIANTTGHYIHTMQIFNPILVCWMTPYRRKCTCQSRRCSRCISVCCDLLFFDESSPITAKKDQRVQGKAECFGQSLLCLSENSRTRVLIALGRHGDGSNVGGGRPPKALPQSCAWGILLRPTSCI